MLNKILCICICIGLLFCVTACSGEYNGKYVKDAEGNVYQLEHRVGAVYFIRPIDKNKIVELSK